MHWRCEGLFSDHFLTHRLPASDGYPTVEQGQACLAFVQSLINPGLLKANEEDTEDRFISPVLQNLGFGYSNRRQIPGNRDLPDYLLYALPEDAESAFQAGSYYDQSIAILEAKRYNRNLSEKSRDGKKTPHQQIRDYLSDALIPWGILTNGAKWRLYARDERPSSYFEFDLVSAVQANDSEALRLFLALFSKPSLAPDSAGRRPVEDTREGSLRFREEVERELRRQVFDGVESLGQGFLLHSSNGLEPADLPSVFEHSLVLLYRVLFVLNAEARGLLPTTPANEKARRYLNSYSLEHVRQELQSPQARTAYADPSTTRLYTRLRDLFRLINGQPPAPGRPDPNSELGVPRYNGGLFDPERYPFLEDNVVGDDAMADVLSGLMFRRERGEVISFDYANLGERHLGAIYEGLLEHVFAWDEEAFRPVLRNDKGERKTSGAYYTPEPLVHYIVGESLKPLLAGCEASLTGYSVIRDPEDGIVPGDGDPDDRFANAVLRLKVCDPAMGSGHFLVEAVQELSEAIVAHPTTCLRPELNLDGTARLRTDGSGETLQTFEATLAYWKRRVVESCVYGVDLNPLAVELSKLSLWLKTVDRVPLNFLDHHLRCGNALLGVPLRALAQFVSPANPGRLDWSKPVQLDYDLQQALAAAIPQAIAGIHEIEDVETDTHEAAKRKEAKWRELATNVLPPFRSIADLWIAPWLGAPTGFVEFQRAVNNWEAATTQALPAAPAIAPYRPFHWELEFPDIFFAPDGQPRVDRGFDAVVGNPPWERIKLQENEFFSARAPEVAREPRASLRKAAIAKLRISRPELWKEYEAAKDVADRTAYFLQKSAFYPALGRGDTNLYSVFVERSLGLLAPAGRLGMLVPSGIASDAGSAEFFAGLAAAGRIAGVIDFENRNAIFEDVHRSFKFCMFMATGPKAPATSAKCGFYLHDVAELGSADRLFELSPSDFRLFNPNTGNAPVFRTRRAADLTKQVYEAVPAFWRRPRVEGGRQIMESNPWGASFSTLFHMTNDSNLFRTSQELERDGFWPAPGWVYTKGSQRYLPLYEGKMVQAYDHRAATIEIHADNVHRPAQGVPIEAGQKADVSFSAKPLYWVAERQVPASKSGWRLAYKDVTAPTNVRTFIAAAIPSVACGNTLCLITARDGLPAHCLLANLNSLALDFVARQKVGGQHLNFFIVEQLPVLPPEAYDQAVGTQTLRQMVNGRVLELSYTANDMEPFARDLGFDGEPFPWDEERRLHLKCQLDALYFAAYGISRDDAEYILPTFPILQREDEQQFGTFRTKELILHYMAAYAAGNVDAWVQA